MKQRTRRPRRRGRRLGGLGSERRIGRCALALGLAASVAVVAAGDGALLAGTGLGFPGGLWIGLLGLASAGGHGDFVSDLVERIERVRAGESDVDFETDRDGDVRRLYDAVSGLAAAAGDGEDEAAERDEDGGAGGRDEDDEAGGRDGDAEDYRRELYRTTSARDLDDEEKVERLLELGVDRLGVENGLISRIDRESGRYEVESVAGGGFVAAGTVSDLSETFCRRAVESEDVLGISDATADADDPGHAEWGIGTYIGGKIEVGSELYGTLCFVDPAPREAPFTHEERTFVHMMARWLSYRFEQRRHEERLRESERRFRAVFEDPDELVALLAADGTVRECNGTAAAYGSGGLAEAEGRPFAELSWWRGPTAETVEAGLERASGDEYVEFDARVDGPDGGERCLDGVVRPVTDDAGAVVSLVVTARDVTELRRRERELRRHRRYTEDVLDAIDDVFYVVDEDGRFRRWNDALETVTGYAEAEIASMNSARLFAEADRPAVADAIDDVLETGHSRVEATFVTRDGDAVPHEFVADAVETPDGERVVAGIGRDVTERRERERELRRTRELLEQAQRIADVGGWELDLTTDPPEMTWTDELYRLHEMDPEGGVTLAEAMELYHPEDRERIEETIAAAIESGEGYDMEFRVRRDEEYRWVRALADVVEEGGEVVALRGSIQDVTSEKERERALEALHEVARGLLRTESEAEVAERVIATAGEILDAERVTAYLVDDETNRLDPVASAGFGADRPRTVAVGDDDPVWTAYATGEPTAVEAGETLDAPGAGDGDASDASGVAIPVGDYGVVVVEADDEGIDGQTRRLVETLVATTAAALDRIASEAALRERDAELATRNRRLERQMAITDIIRGIDRTLIGAESREEVERTVCERLVEDEDVAFAWIGGRDAAGESVVPRAWAGGSATYLDEIGLDRPAGSDEPAVVAERTGRSVVVENVLADVSDGEWRRRALAAGYHSVVAVPLAYQGYSHGILTVYGDEPDAFGELEEAVFAELGEGIANAIDAIQTREALYADTLLRLTLRLSTESVLGRVADRAECTVEYEGLVSQSGSETRLFFAATGAPPEAIHASVEALVPITECRLVSERDGRAVFELTVTGGSLPAKLVRHGGRPRSITASGSATEVVVDVPTTTDVREFVAMLRESYPDVELTARRNVRRTKRTRQELISSLFDELTDRQIEVLRTAYFAGFFEWPRESTGEEVAEMLGVTQPTVNRHLRLGQARLLAQLFEEAEGATIVTA